MPFPALLVWGAAAVAGAVGVGKTVKAVKTNNKANDYNEEAEEIIEKASKKAEKARTSSNEAIQTLGQTKIDALNFVIKPFISEFAKVKDVKFTSSKGLNELNKIALDENDIKEIETLSSAASSIASGTIAGGTLGAITAFGAYNGAMLLGAASTGTAIGTLSGAAATNATLAWLGGGSLAAGGFGVTGGACVLGGLVAAPALLVLGCVIGSKADKKLDQALENLAQAEEFKEQMKVLRSACKGIKERANLFTDLLNNLKHIMQTRLTPILEIMANNNYKYANFSEEEKEFLMCCCSIIKTIKTILDTPILTEDGNLSKESKSVAMDVRKQIESF